MLKPAFINSGSSGKIKKNWKKIKKKEKKRRKKKKEEKNTKDSEAFAERSSEFISVTEKTKKKQEELCLPQ